MIGSLPPAGFVTPYNNVRGGEDTQFARSRADPTRADPTREESASPAREASANTSTQRLTDEELAEVRALQQRDREVRAHEMAHVAVGGDLVLRGAQFEYETGPDGIRYAVGGDVLIDTSPGRTPEETLIKAERIRATALAPADPSPQDRQVAAMAAQMALQAQMELAVQQRESAQDDTPSAEDAGRIDGDARGTGTAERMREAYALVGGLAGNAAPTSGVSIFA